MVWNENCITFAVNINQYSMNEKTLYKTSEFVSLGSVQNRKFRLLQFATSQSLGTLQRINCSGELKNFYFIQSLSNSNNIFEITLSKIESLKLVRKPTYHVSRNVPFFVFRKFWFALCLLYGKTLSKNFVENRKFIIG